jgi:hypothetical protein
LVADDLELGGGGGGQGHTHGQRERKLGVHSRSPRKDRLSKTVFPI